MNIREITFDLVAEEIVGGNVNFSVGIIEFFKNIFFIIHMKFAILNEFIDHREKVVPRKVFLTDQEIDLIDDFKKFLMLGVDGFNTDAVFGVPDEVHRWGSLAQTCWRSIWVWNLSIRMASPPPFLTHGSGDFLYC